MALVRNLAALLCVVLASLAFVAQAVLAARGMYQLPIPSLFRWNIDIFSHV